MHIQKLALSSSSLLTFLLFYVSCIRSWKEKRDALELESRSGCATSDWHVLQLRRSSVPAVVTHVLRSMDRCAIDGSEIADLRLPSVEH
jgi:hypothetical protein